MINFANKLYFKGLQAKDKVMSLVKNERGEANIIAIIIILAIVIALAIVFRKYIVELFNQIWDEVFADADSAMGDIEGGTHARK